MKELIIHPSRRIIRRKKKENMSSTTTATNRRLLTLQQHIFPSVPSSIEAQQCSSSTINSYSSNNNIKRTATTTNNDDRYDSQSFDHEATFPIYQMADILRGSQLSRQELINMYKIVDQPQLLDRKLYNMKKEDARLFITEQAKLILKHPDMALGSISQDPVKLLQRIGIAGMLSNSLGTKLGVHIGLFGGSIVNLGTSRHEKYIKPIETFELPGAFLMTELTHGSNVRQLQTTATYDPKTEEFVIHTPSNGAIKWWIGNAALNAHCGTVFARLITQGKDYGVHAFVTPLRDPKTEKTLPGIYIGDCGDKVGLHGVDNGFVRFDKVRVPRENLLNKFGDVDADGTYRSEITSEGRRFAAVLGELINGRTTLSAGAVIYRKMAITIAVRYASRRRQFAADSNSTETLLIDYKSHCMVLMPILASTYAASFAVTEMMDKNFRRLNQRVNAQPLSEEELAESHALIAGMKAIYTWDTQRMVQQLRESCGGHGYSAYNRFGQIRDDHDIHQTYEGDNTVLIQQLGGYLMKQFSKQFEGNVITDSVTFLRKKMGVYATRRNPLITRWGTKKHLRSTEFHLQAFEYRTAKLLQTVAQEFNKKKHKLGAFYSFGQAVPLMIQLGKAYIEQYALEQFVKQLESIPDKTSPVYEALKLTCDVYALSVIDKNIIDFLDIVKKRKANAISQLLEELCVEMKYHAVSLVDAFEIPDFVLDAPIGLAKQDYTQTILQFAIDRNSNSNNN
jgi:acyl-CoA oxidase